MVCQQIPRAIGQVSTARKRTRQALDGQTQDGPGHAQVISANVKRANGRGLAPRLPAIKAYFLARKCRSDQTKN